MHDKQLGRVGDSVYDFAEPRKPKLIATWMKGTWYRLKQGKVAMEYDVVDQQEMVELAMAPRVR